LPRPAPDAPRYDRVAVAFHWAIAILVLANLPLGMLHERIEEGFDYSAIWIHKSIGLTVLMLSLARLAWRLAHRPPPLPAELAAWQALAARIVHALFYALMIALPLTGWIRSSGGPYPLSWFRLFDVPKLPVAEDGVLDSAASALHDRLGWLMLALVLLHVAAALHHGLARRDGLFRRMLF
jgi:cytochrome b561